MPAEIEITAVAKVFAIGLFKLFRAYFELLEAVFTITFPDYKRPRYIRVLVDAIEPSSIDIDERIKKIDAARDNLNDAISAISELRAQADENKRDLEDALHRIQIAESQKSELSKQLEALKQLADADTVAFRKIVGLPTRSDLWRERLLGFASGIIASIIASVLFFVALKILKIST